jgi:chromosomal replication initiation ATPase DnaA
VSLRTIGSSAAEPIGNPGHRRAESIISGVRLGAAPTFAGRWIEEAQNLIIEGPAGVGKSWLACALGQKACRDNRSVLYQRILRMFADLTLARGDGRYLTLN